MKLIVHVAGRRLELTCQLGEYNGDGNFTHPLVGEATLESVLGEWSSVQPEDRAYRIVGLDDHRILILAHPTVGMQIVELEADDVSWLFPLDLVAHELQPWIRWEIGALTPHPPQQATEIPSVRQAQRAVSDALRNDPSFWVDEHSDSL